MKKVKKKVNHHEMRAEYKASDFKRLERGKFYKQVTARSNVVVLEPDVAKAFPNSEIVNETLSGLLKLVSPSLRRRSQSKQTRSKAAQTG